MASLLWDIGKQNSPRCGAAERNVPFGAAAERDVPFGAAAERDVPFGTIVFAWRMFIEKLNKI